MTRGALAVFPVSPAPFRAGDRVSVAGRRGLTVAVNAATVIVEFDDGEWDEVSSREAEEGR